jgi:hypothetical protein
VLSPVSESIVSNPFAFLLVKAIDEARNKKQEKAHPLHKNLNTKLRESYSNHFSKKRKIFEGVAKFDDHKAGHRSYKRHSLKIVRIFKNHSKKKVYPLS